MKKYLPLGSVVTLKNAKKKMMIIGRYQVCNGETFDYSACPFPEGYINKDNMYVFNNDDVDCLYYVGMQNEEEFTFRKALVAEAEAKEKTKED